jgi:hypothetical protein
VQGGKVRVRKIASEKIAKVVCSECRRQNGMRHVFSGQFDPFLREKSAVAYSASEQRQNSTVRVP